MIVQVKLFARARDLARSDQLSVELSDHATVAELRQRLRERCPALTELLTRCVVAIDAEFAEDQQTLTEANEVALIPPVSGGSRSGKGTCDDLLDPRAD